MKKHFLLVVMTAMALGTVFASEQPSQLAQHRARIGGFIPAGFVTPRLNVPGSLTVIPLSELYLESNDEIDGKKKTIVINPEAARLSRMLSDMMQSLEGKPQGKIPLPNINGPTLRLMVLLLNYMYDNGYRTDQTKEQRPKIDLKPKILELTKDNPAVNIALLLAANYLDLEPVIDATAAIIGNNLKQYGLSVQNKKDEHGNDVMDANGKVEREVVSTLEAWNSLPPELLVLVMYYAGKLAPSIHRTGDPFAEDVEDAYWSLQGDRLATISRGRVVQLWDRQGRAIGNTFGQNITDVYWSPQGDHLATRSWTNQEGVVQLWDAQGHVMGDPFGQDILKVYWSPKGDRLVTTSQAYVAQLWDAQGRAIGNPFVQYDRRVYWSPQGDRWATLVGRGSAQLWDTQGQAITNPFGGLIWNMYWSPNGECLATKAGVGSFVQLWNAEGRAVSQQFRQETKTRNVYWSPEGDCLAILSLAGVVQLWNTQGQAISAPFGKEIADVYWSPQGNRLVTRSKEGVVQFKQWVNGQILPIEWDIRGQKIKDVYWSPHGDYLATISEAGVVQLWETQEWSMGRAMGNSSGQGEWTVYWSPRGDCFATRSVLGGVMQLWKIKYSKKYLSKHLYEVMPDIVEFILK